MAAPGLHTAILHEIKRTFPELKGLRVLDAPCGTGALSEELAKTGAIVEGLDLAPVRASDYGATFKVENLEACILPANCYDLILSIEGIEHLQNPMAWFEKIALALKPGGVLILSTPNPDALSSRWKVFTRGYPQYFSPVPMNREIFRDSGHIHSIPYLFVEWACLRNTLELTSIKTKSERLPAFVENFLYRIFYKSFPEKIGKLIKGSVDIYTIRKPNV
jgi:SAM-dependent methyltransferase